MIMLKLPKVKAFENGSLELVEANGWEIKYPIAPAVSISTIIQESSGIELIITCTRLEEGESVFLSMAIPLIRDLLFEETFLEGADDEDGVMDNLLAAAVNKGLASLEVQYNEAYTYAST